VAAENARNTEFARFAVRLNEALMSGALLIFNVVLSVFQETRAEAALHTSAVAQRTSRRSFLAHLSRGLLGAAIFPLLPVSRVVGDAGAFDFGDNKPASDPESCNYWRHCALDGIP
jgi:hypothetical protein